MDVTCVTMLFDVIPSIELNEAAAAVAAAAAVDRALCMCVCARIHANKIS